MEWITLIHLLASTGLIVFSMYLSFYYLNHSIHLKSSYFRGLGMFFAGKTLIWILWTIVCIMFLTEDIVIAHEIMPCIISIILFVSLVITFNFVKCTDNQ